MADHPSNGDPTLHLHRLEAVMDIARSVGSTLEIDALLQLIMDKVTHLMRADRSTLYIVDHDAGELWSKVLQADELHEIRLAMGDGIAGWVAQSGERLLLADAYDDDRFDRSWDQTSGFRTRSLLCVPFRNAEQVVVGVMQCLNKAEGPFDDGDAELLESIGGQCAVAIDNAFLYESLVERNVALEKARTALGRAHAELQLLYELERRLTLSTDVGEVVAVALEQIGGLVHADSGAMLVVDGDGGEVFSQVYDESDLQWRRVDAEAVRGWLAALDDHHDVGALDDGVLDDLLLAEAGDETPHCAVSATLHDRNQTLGIVQLVHRREEEQYNHDVLRVLTLVAAATARALVVLREREEGARAERLSLLGQAVGGILHDLRTPMGAVGGYAELMAEEDDPAERAYYVERITRAMGHMESMTREVLDFARGGRDILVHKVQLNAFIDEVVEIVQPEMDRFGIVLTVEDAYRGSARFDEAKIKRVICNLARNAGQAMSGEGHFTWSLDKVDDSLVMAFADDGPGIPVEVRGRLFEFFSTHGKAEGTGLGLAMAKKIVDAHGGALTYETRTGEGTTFRIELPL